jgi:putative hemolysin
VLELVIAILLIALNGVFALSELAVVSARRPRLRAMAEQRRKGAAAALALSEEPGRFLSTVQIGITLVGILAGAFSGAALGDRMTDFLVDQGMPRSFAGPVGYGFVIGAITYFSVIIGELVPKQLALRHAERIACAVAQPMMTLSRIALPAVWLLDASTKAVFRMLKSPVGPDSAVTEEEIKTVVAEAQSAGVIEADERRMISGVLRLGARPVGGLLTPRTAVDWIDLNDDADELRRILVETRHSRLPVADGDPDNIIGVVQSRDLLADLLQGRPADVRAHLKRAPVLPDTVDALDVLAILRDAEVPMVIVHDEYGHFEGLVTPADILETIAGVFRSDASTTEPDAHRRADGSWLLEGSMPADDMAETLGLTLPDHRDYHTVAGFLIASLQHLPATGEMVDRLGWRFEVVDMDGRRIDKVLATRIDADGHVNP